MSKWTIDDGNTQETFDAENEEQARMWAEEWLAAGEYGPGGCTVDAAVSGPDGERFRVVVEIEADEEALDEHHTNHKQNSHEHEYESPYSVLGGCRENPGVWGGSGAGVSITEVCQCGAFRHTYSDSPRTEIAYPFGLWPKGEPDVTPEWFEGRPEE